MSLQFISISFFLVLFCFCFCIFPCNEFTKSLATTTTDKPRDSSLYNTLLMSIPCRCGDCGTSKGALSIKLNARRFLNFHCVYRFPAARWLRSGIYLPSHAMTILDCHGHARRGTLCSPHTSLLPPQMKLQLCSANQI